MAKLYELSEMIENFDPKVDEETGEILNLDELEQLEMQKDKKIENIALWYKNLLSDAEQYEKEENYFAEKKKSANNKAKSIKEFLNNFLNGDKFRTVRVNISYRKSNILEIQNGADIPSDYLKYIDPKPDKIALKKALESGLQLKGVSLIENQNIQIK